jgi:hypothetical protein
VRARLPEAQAWADRVRDSEPLSLNPRAVTEPEHCRTVVLSVVKDDSFKCSHSPSKNSANKTLYIAEFGEGYDLGTIISEDEMDLVYLRDGETAEVSVERLYRILLIFDPRISSPALRRLRPRSRGHVRPHARGRLRGGHPSYPLARIAKLNLTICRSRFLASTILRHAGFLMNSFTKTK